MLSKAPIATLSTAHLLSRSSLLKHVAVAIYPNFLTANVTNKHNTDVTACVWTYSTDVADVINWAKYWGGQTIVLIWIIYHSHLAGPVSLLIVTATPPDSPAFHHLRLELNEIYNTSPLGNRLNAHVLHKIPDANHAPNAYLNFVRLFAQTENVVIFPNALSRPVPLKMYDAALKRTSSHSHSSTSTFKSEQIVFSDNSPSQNVNATAPFPDLTPLFIHRDYPLWCTERFFTAPTRATDWQECIWQFWIESYGRTITVSDAKWKSVLEETEAEDRQGTHVGR